MKCKRVADEASKTRVAIRTFGGALSRHARRIDKVHHDCDQQTIPHAAAGRCKVSENFTTMSKV